MIRKITLSASTSFERDDNSIKTISPDEIETFRSMMEIVGHNTAQVINGFAHINKNLSWLFMSYYRPENRLLKEQVFHADFMSFDAKRKLFFVINDDLKLFEGKLLKDTKEEFFRVMRHRNMLAHGDFNAKSVKGKLFIEVSYYSGGHKKMTLDDERWEKIKQSHSFLSKQINLFHLVVRHPHMKDELHEQFV